MQSQKQKLYINLFYTNGRIFMFYIAEGILYSMRIHSEIKVLNEIHKNINTKLYVHLP